ncbi:MULTISPECIES: hypothetical protein [Burkholderia]|uniref:hypothetical protein n=1 Tax=Burkholderia TaxID=32008 RepID=UPI001E535632|nr:MULTISPECIES: hypothetical protein [unclassified Burkholderia]UEP31829.1 hypothetical protein LMA01_21765 [Burkholderia sp. B21-007]UEP45582.1 hypothetical protein LMA02_23010 [Burkholderia sp. B21-005]
MAKRVPDGIAQDSARQRPASGATIAKAHGKRLATRSEVIVANDGIRAIPTAASGEAN